MLLLKVFLNANTTMRISKKYNLFYSQNDMVTCMAKAFVRIMLVVIAKSGKEMYWLTKTEGVTNNTL